MKTLQIILSLMFTFGIGTAYAQKSNLYGSWKATNGSITSFTANNMTMAGTNYNYEVQGNFINVYNNMGESMQYKYQVKNGKLYLYAEGVGTYVLTKVKTQEKTTGYANNNNASPNYLTGTTWRATTGNIMKFKTKTVKVGNDTYSYQISGNQLTMYDNTGESISYQYNIQGNKLYLTTPGQGSYVLTRANANAVSKVQNTNYKQQTVNNKGANRLYGTFCSYSSSGYSGNGGYSTTQRIRFDGKGHYKYGSESSYSGGNNGGGYAGGNSGYSGTYKVVGNKGVVLTATDGSQYNVAIYFVQKSGVITELKYDGTIYAKNLCD